MIDPSFWRGKRVFLTGHTGFKGSWLTLWLHHLGAHVTAYSLEPPTTPSLFDEIAGSTLCHSIIGDIRERTTLTRALAHDAPEIVLHLAAQALVKAGYTDPITTYETNVMGTAHLLEAVRATPSVRAVVVISSDKCYENQEREAGYREDEPMGGSDPYSSSKGCTELLVASYRQSYFNPKNPSFNHPAALASARAGNVVGGGDWAADRLVPDLMRAFAQKLPAKIRNPLAVRPWQFVLEPLAGYLMLAERLWHEGQAFASAWNFGPDSDQIKPVEWIADHLTSKWGGEARWELDSGAHPHEHKELRLDCRKARNALSWKPALSLEETLSWIVTWYQRWHHGDDLAAATLSQIENYQALLAPRSAPAADPQSPTA